MTRRSLTRNLLLYLLIAAGAVVLVTPFMWMVSTALKANVYVIEYPPELIPANPSLDNFIQAWAANNFRLYSANSALVAVTTTVLSVFLSAMMAYAFARFSFPAKELLFYIILLVLMVPNMVGIIPQFFLIKTLGLRNSLWGLILVYAASNLSLNTFLLRGFIEQLPHELEEAILIDGGGYWTIFLNMIIPLSAPALATVALFTFMGSWGEFVWALTVIDDPLKRTLPVAIATFQGQHGTNWGLVFAASLIAAAPIMALFVSLQRYYVGGLTSGSIKG